MTRDAWLRYWRCERKRPFRTRERAEAALRRVVRPHKRAGVRVYACCYGEHRHWGRAQVEIGRAAG